MAVTYPRTLPMGIRFQPSRFVLNRPVVSSPSGGARINYTKIDDDAWQIDFTTYPLLESELGIVYAWWLSLQDGLKTALISQTALCYPIAHTGSNSRVPAQDTGTLGVINGNVITINDVSAALILSPGDVLGFIDASGKRGLARVIDSTGNGTLSRNVTIEPALRNYITAGSIVTFEKPTLLMRAINGSFSLNGSVRPSISFSMIEAAQ